MGACSRGTRTTTTTLAAHRRRQRPAGEPASARWRAPGRDAAAQAGRRNCGRRRPKGSRPSACPARQISATMPKGRARGSAPSAPTSAGIWCALGHRLGEKHHDVVGEDDADADDEAGELAVAGDAEPERQADDREDEAGDRERELLLDRHDLVVRRLCPAGLRLDVLPELGDGLLGEAAWQVDRRKHRSGSRRMMRSWGKRVGHATRPAWWSSSGCRRSGRARPSAWPVEHEPAVPARKSSTASGFVVSATSTSFQPAAPARLRRAGTAPSSGNPGRRPAAGRRFRPSW